MQKVFSTLLLSAVFTPSLALAQSQAPGTQQLISELQQPKQEPKAGEVDLSQNVEMAAADGPDIGEIQIGSIIVSEPDGTVHPEFGPVIERYIGSTVGQAGLKEIATAIASEARAQGYIFASAYVPQQEVALGSIRVIVDLGRVDEIQVEGNNNARLASMLADLKGKYARKAEVERALLLIRDIPGVIINGTDFVRDGGRGKLIVMAGERRASGWVGLDNYGDKEVGPYRTRLEVDYAGIIDGDDRISVAATATPIQPDELTFVNARYTNLLDNRGTQFSFTGAAGRSHETQPGSDWQSRSRYAAIGISRPILRSNAASLWLSSEFAFLDADQRSGAGAVLEDHVTTISLSASGNVKLAGGRLSGGVTYVRGLDLFDATKELDPSSSRLDGSGLFDKGQAWLNWFGVLGSGFSMRIAGNGQIASRPLLASQEIGLGGIGYGRAYSFYERSGDEGAMGLFELRHATDNPTKFIDWIQFYGFVDGGYVSNIDGGFGSGGLTSSGGGIRSGFGKAELGLEIAVPVDAIRSETLDRSPRINFNLGYRF